MTTAECLIMKFHYRNSSSTGGQKGKKLAGLASFILQKMAIGKKRDHINLQKHNPEIILMLLALRANFPFIIFVRFWLFHDCFKNEIWGSSFDKNSVLGTRLLYFLNHCFWTELSVCHSTHWSKLTLMPFLIWRTFDHSRRWEMIEEF